MSRSWPARGSSTSTRSIAPGSGRTLFQGVQRRLGLTLEKTRAFGNGAVVLWYQPAPA